MLLSSFLLSLGSVALTNALSSLTISGSKFFQDGNQFYIKGISYQLTPDDPLIDTTQCSLDAAMMKTIGANMVRVYHVDPSANHDGCMKAFADNGIYTIIDLDTFHTQIEQDGPPHWNQTQLTEFTKVLDAFAAYENSAGFFIGNEVITNENGSWAAPYVKAAVRDVKAHIKSKNYNRPIYIGYSAADIASLRPNLQNYLVCGDDDSANIDFFGLNAYEWCGQSSYMVSGYDQLTVNATNYPVPIFFSETGCNTPKPRTFDDQGAIFGPQMDSVWSGAIIYEWISEANDYGLISYGSKLANPATAVGGDPYPRKGTPTPVSPDFNNLKTAWAAATPTGVKAAAYKPTNSAPTCPPMTSGVWNVDPSSALPSLGQVANKAAATGAPTGTSTTNGTSASQTAKSDAQRVAGSFMVFFGLIGSFLIMM